MYRRTLGRMGQVSRSRSRSRLGDAGDGYIYATGPNAGQPVTDSPLVVSTDIPPSFSDIFGTAAPTVTFAPVATPVPAVSPTTLLQAEALPNAPAVVTQAAAQYSAANPISSWFNQSSLISGVPNYLLAGGFFLLLLIPMASSKGKRR